MALVVDGLTCRQPCHTHRRMHRCARTRAKRACANVSIGHRLYIPSLGLLYYRLHVPPVGMSYHTSHACDRWPIGLLYYRLHMPPVRLLYHCCDRCFWINVANLLFSPCAVMSRSLVGRCIAAVCRGVDGILRLSAAPLHPSTPLPIPSPPQATLRSGCPVWVSGPDVRSGCHVRVSRPVVTSRCRVRMSGPGGDGGGEWCRPVAPVAPRVDAASTRLLPGSRFALRIAFWFLYDHARCVRVLSVQYSVSGWQDGVGGWRAGGGRAGAAGVCRRHRMNLESRTQAARHSACCHRCAPSPVATVPMVIVNIVYNCNKWVWQWDARLSSVWILLNGGAARCRAESPRFSAVRRRPQLAGG